MAKRCLLMDIIESRKFFFHSMSSYYIKVEKQHLSEFIASNQQLLLIVVGHFFLIHFFFLTLSRSFFLLLLLRLFHSQKVFQPDQTKLPTDNPTRWSLSSTLLSTHIYVQCGRKMTQNELLLIHISLKNFTSHYTSIKESLVLVCWLDWMCVLNSSRCSLLVVALYIYKRFFRYFSSSNRIRIEYERT